MSSNLDLDKIVNNFIQRGVNLSPPASWQELASLDRFMKYKVDTSVKRLYLTFNGFRNMDFDLRSEIRLWPITEILSSSANAVEDKVVFADFSLGSQLYMCNFSKRICPVTDMDTGTEVSPSLIDFAKMVSEGHFDF